MINRFMIFATLVISIASAGGCRPGPDIAPVSRTCATGLLCVTGTARHLSLEGGFWAVVGDDKITYDPMGGLPAAFQKEGLRVYLVARRRDDVGSFHMAGPIVEIVSIEPVE